MGRDKVALAFYVWVLAIPFDAATMTSPSSTKNRVQRMTVAIITIHCLRVLN